MPDPQLFEQSPHAPILNSPGQSIALQTSCVVGLASVHMESLTRTLNPFTQTTRRVCWPEPHERLHRLHSPTAQLNVEQPWSIHCRWVLGFGWGHRTSGMIFNWPSAVTCSQWTLRDCSPQPPSEHGPHAPKCQSDGQSSALQLRTADRAHSWDDMATTDSKVPSSRTRSKKTSRICVPSPHDLLHGVQGPCWQFDGQLIRYRLQTCMVGARGCGHRFSSTAIISPLLLSISQEIVRVWVPGPQVLLHSPHGPRVSWGGQSIALHLSTAVGLAVGHNLSPTCLSVPSANRR